MDFKKLRVRVVASYLLQIPLLLIVLPILFFCSLPAAIPNLVLFALLPLLTLIVGARYCLKTGRVAAWNAGLLLGIAWLYLLTGFCMHYGVGGEMRHSVCVLAGLLLLLMLHIGNFLEIGQCGRPGMLFAYLFIVDGVLGTIYALFGAVVHAFDSMTGRTFGAGLLIGLGVTWGVLLIGSVTAFTISRLFPGTPPGEKA